MNIIKSVCATAILRVSWRHCKRIVKIKCHIKTSQRTLLTSKLIYEQRRHNKEINNVWCIISQFGACEVVISTEADTDVLLARISLSILAAFGDNAMILKVHFYGPKNYSLTKKNVKKFFSIFFFDELHFIMHHYIPLKDNIIVHISRAFHRSYRKYFSRHYNIHHAPARTILPLIL